MNLAPFRAIIFDCDGVLVDSERLGLRSLQLALRDEGLDLSLGSLTRFSGRSYSETLAILERESGLAMVAATVAERIDDHYQSIVGAEGLGVCPGIPELLSCLKARGLPFTLASSGPRRKVLFSLQSAGLASAFPEFICGDDVTLAKPAPDPYLAAAALISIAPTDCLAVEDAPNGVRSARAAGMQVLGVTTTFERSALAGATEIVDSMERLADYIRELPTAAP